MTVEIFEQMLNQAGGRNVRFIDCTPSKKQKPYKIQHEDILHKACVQWFGMQYGMRDDIFINHCPNENPSGDKNKMIKYNTKMKSMGRMTGFPDLEIGYKGKVLFIELKSENGRLSDNQKLAHQNIQKAGFEVVVIRSLEEFMEKVKNFIDT